MTSPEQDSPIQQLGELFGGYRAEWLKERIFELFTEPEYLPVLEARQPCVLEGGRGTGKTTVLRGLSYEGQFALQGQRIGSITAWRYIGLYHRIDTNRVSAFNGPELEPDRWTRIFAHYINLAICNAAMDFVHWYETTTKSIVVIPSSTCEEISASLHIDSSGDVSTLRASIRKALRRLEAAINNVADGWNLRLSMQKAPIDDLTEALCQFPAFRGKQFFILIDEYENLAEYQQRVVNTLIKHSTDYYTFKIGVRELGWRCKVTLNENEVLHSPADYQKISIPVELVDGSFSTFAQKVCNARLRKIRLEGHDTIPGIRELLPGLSHAEEADRLGAASLAESIRAEAPEGSPLANTLASLSALEVCCAKFWAECNDCSLDEWHTFYDNNSIRWREWLSNYEYAVLFTIRRGKRGISKYYAGWDTFCHLAAGNIRYLLELVDQSLLAHIRNGHPLTVPVDQQTQTKVAIAVARKNLAELEGIGTHGAHLTKLLLGLGRVFGVMAAKPAGHTPEVTQFRMSDHDAATASSGNTQSTRVESLLKAGVMHLALLRSAGDKLVSEGETRDYQYSIHSLYSAFFRFSHRRKRRMILEDGEIAGLIDRPADTIKSILAKNNRQPEDEALPEQLLLFEGYYDGNSR